MKSNSNLTTKKFYRYDWDGTHDISAPFNTSFSTFQWRGKHSWVDFGCFIINKKDDLKWLGFSTKNNYSAPIYGNNAQSLISTTFDGAKLSLNLGLYGITQEDYRKFFNWMDPLIVDKLYLNYDKEYYYVSKVANISEATKYIIGYQNNKTLYYAEVKVTFELQGEICGWKDQIINWEYHESFNNINKCWIREGLDIHNYLPTANWISDLNNSIQIYFKEIPIDTDVIQIEAEVFPVALWLEKHNDSWEYYDYKTDNAINLFSIILNHKNQDTKNFINFIYDSADGILYNTSGSGEKRLIDTGFEGLTSLNVNKFLLPSRLNDANFYTEKQDITFNNNTGRLIRDVAIQIKINNEIIDNHILDDNDIRILISSQLKTPVI